MDPLKREKINLAKCEIIYILKELRAKNINPLNNEFEGCKRIQHYLLILEFEVNSFFNKIDSVNLQDLIFEYKYYDI